MTRTWPVKLAAGVAMAFGGLTLLSGGQVLFGGADAGAVVPFVLWFNFLSGFVYVIVGAGIAMRKRWAARLAITLTVAIAVVFALFGLHIAQGGAFEPRTLGAMTLRLAAWAAISAVAARGLR